MIAVGAAVAVAAPPDDISTPGSATEVADRVSPPSTPMIGGCPVYPNDNSWNIPLAGAPLHPQSAQIISGLGGSLHPDFGENPDYGIPYVVVPQNQPLVPITYTDYGDESDPGPFPIPLNAPVEAGSDGHVLVVQQGTCQLFELFVARRSGGGWAAASGAKFDLRSNLLRPLGWTSADAAGLPILPGLVRYDEVAAGHIDHAIRVTFNTTRRAYVLPATHFASSNTSSLALPMGARLRLRADYDISALPTQAKVIAQAMKTYGLIVADNGSNWYFQGAPNAGWDDDQLNALKGIPGSAFQVVDSGPPITS